MDRSDCGGDIREKSGEVRVIEAIDDLAEKIETEFPNEPEIRAELHHRISDIYRARYDDEKAYIHALAALQTRRQVYGEKHAEVAKDLYYLSAAIRLSALYRRNDVDLDKSEELLREAIAMMREVDPQNVNLPYMLLDLGTARLKADQSANHTDAPFDNLSQTDLDEAQALYQEAAALFLRRYGNDHVTAAIMSVCLGEIAFARKNLAEAERLLNEGLARERELNERPLTADPLYRLCRVKIAERDYSSAEKLCNESLATYAQGGEVKAWPIVGVHYTLSRLYELRGDHARSLLEADRAGAIREQVIQDGR